MQNIDPVTLAGFRLLAAVARADGVVQEGERNALLDVLGPEHRDLVDQLLEEPIDVDAEVARLPDDSTRAQVYRSAFALAYVDDHMAHDEVGILEKIWPDRPEDSLLKEVFGEVQDTLLPSNIMPVADPAQRAAEIDHDILKYSIMAAVVGATPIPVFGILADIAVVGIQLKLARDIGQYWGHTLDGPAARSLVGTAVGGTTMRFAVNNLARFLPGFGLVVAATSSFASTFALGKVVEAYFAGDRSLSEADMRDLFKKARAEGQQLYSSHAETIDRTRKTAGPEIEKLAHAAKDQEISTLEFEKRVIDAIAIDDEHS